MQLAQAVHAHLPLEEIRLIPAANPLLRAPPIATAAQRLAMVNIALADYSWLAVDDREIKRGGFSYTMETLESLRAEMPDVSLCWIMSMDQFLQFDQWRSWEDIPELAHLIVADRPGYAPALNASLQALVHQRCVFEADLLHEKSAGLIFFQKVPAIPISGTQIRASLKAGISVEGLVPEKVWEYIDQEGLYV